AGPDYACGLPAAGGEEDHGYRPARADRAAELEPADAGEHHVEHHELRRLTFHEPAHLAAVSRHHDTETVALEVLRNDVPDSGLVVDDEHGARGLHGDIVAGRT